jgi:nucleotide-binding universal stress UspA family protein
MTRKPAEIPLSDPSTRIVGRTAGVIVVGIDGSPSSWDAFDWAVGESTRLHADLIAVHVQQALDPFVAIGAPFAYVESKEAADLVAEELYNDARRRAHELGVKITLIAGSGDTAVLLAQVAQSLKADLIVVGKSTKILHHLGGSIGRRLIFSQNAPAIVVVP